MLKALSASKGGITIAKTAKKILVRYDMPSHT